MDAFADVVGAENGSDERCVADFAFIERNFRGQCGPVSAEEIVQHNNALSVFSKKIDRNAADVSSASSHEN
jgi:hypothetical protein